MSTSASPIFTGSSRYSQDFAQIIDRAVSIASLPITQLTNQKNTLSAQQAAYQSLSTKFASVRFAIGNLQATTGSGFNSVASSNPAAATASISAGAAESTFDLNVIDPGVFARAMSQDGLTQVTDPTTQSLSASTAFTLTVDGVTTNLTVPSGSLSDLAVAINQAHAGVQATVVNIGPPASPDYRLSLQSTAVKDVNIQLNDGSSDLLNPLVTGREATYQIDGLPATPISSDSRTIQIAPGVTASIQSAGETSIKVNQDNSSLAMALNSLVSAYNSAVDELDKHRGQGGGALTGESEIWTLSSTLRTIVNYSGASGSVTSLEQLGLSFDDSGHLKFDASALSTAPADALQAFFGDGTQPGFLSNAAHLLDSIDNASSGSLPLTINSLTTQMSHEDELIDANQKRVDLLRDSLNAKMAAADALVASLEQQASYFTGLFDAMKSDSSKN
jgi:flagellar hook-associated protein 2